MFADVLLCPAMRTARFVALAIVLCSCRDRSAPQPDPGVSAIPSSNASAPIASPEPAASALPQFTPEKVTGEAKAMGTHLTYAAFTTPTVDATKTRAAFDDATAEIVRVERLMTTWRPDSEISKINAAAGKAPVAVSQETYDIVAEAVHAAEISEGTFDITFESLHGLWKFDEDLDPHPPTDAQIKAKLPLLNYKHIKLDAAKHTVMLDRDGVKIGLGGIAKGYAVDRASAVLKKAGLSSFFVQAGGDLYTSGKKADGSDWLAGIRDPRGRDGDYFVMLPVTDHAFSTAGDYERSYIVGDKRYHHIIDPRTGYPATASRSVTIWAPTALLADEIDDAVFILGPDKGLKLVESIEGVAAVIVDAKNNVYVSKRLEGKLRFVHPPTDGL
jgi:thiamine biosynthesis lipoprotein